MFQDKMVARNSHRSRTIKVRRGNLIVNSLAEMNTQEVQTWRGEIRVKYDGERGIDEGGLKRDWITSVTRALFDPENGFFTTNRCPNPTSGTIHKNHLQYFTFAGKMIGKAIYDGVNVDCHMPSYIYKEILGLPVDMSDLPEALKWILENDPTSLDTTFVIDVEEFGKRREVPLIPGGENIKVTNENKHDFVNRFIRHRLLDQAKDQLKAFVSGINHIIPLSDLAMFTPKELDLVLCGVPQVDVRDMKRYYHYEYPLIQKFFVVIRHWTNDDLAKLIMFITGSSQVPVGGFKAYEDLGRPITIIAGGDHTRLPVAHTCSNQLALPNYKSERELNEKLHFAISECQGFGFA